MKTMVMAVVLALLLLAAGGVCWTLGSAHERLALLKAQVATMDFQAAANQDQQEPSASVFAAARVPVVGARIGQTTRPDRATADYWLGRYDALATERDTTGTALERNPELLFHAANAAYRASRFDVTDREASVKRMEIIIRSYADVLRNSPDFVDAAYNYEFAARLASALERGRPGATMLAAAKKNEPSIHGRPGLPPRAGDDSDINLIVPKRGDERTDSPEAGKGAPRIRKG